MKSILIATIIFIFTATSIYSQSESEKNEAKKFGMEALELMDKDGKYSEAIELLNKSKNLDPDNIVYPYEIAYAMYHLKKYLECIEILESLTKHKDVNFRIFQLLGNSYDMSGEPDKSINAFKRGLEKFPNSGSLYLGCGIVENGRKNFNEAIRYWEMGVQVEPMFPSNYFWLANTFSVSNEPVWAFFYGEIFMNLERNSNRTIEMSYLLYDLYKEVIKFNSDTSASIDLGDVLTLSDLTSGKVPFTMDFTVGMSIALRICMMEYGNNFSIKFLDKLRTIFLEVWSQKGKDKEIPLVLIDYQKEIFNKGYFEEYNFWLFMQGNEEEFKSWNENNPGKLEKFADWFVPNPIELNGQNFFSRKNF